ncbi:hypothetical protein [Xylanimonas sp. McL0601]|uniref:hypothetical protein n=1 Tax=Xylanimonas sp. McL0601 TaxID=3414739 RepID=UPI003CEB3F19
MRRGYHFVPKYVLGRPADTLRPGRRLPARLRQAVDGRLLKLLTGDPVRFGFPEPDHRIYESHPIVNSLVLHHLGHGDLAVRADVERFDGHHVVFRDGTRGTYDVVVLATGYRLHYPVHRPRAAALGGAGGPGPVPQRREPGRARPVRAWHGRGPRHRLAGAVRAVGDGRGIPAGADREPEGGRRVRGTGPRSAPRSDGRLPLPGPGAHGVLRQQGCVSPGSP